MDPHGLDDCKIGEPAQGQIEEPTQRAYCVGSSIYNVTVYSFPCPASLPVTGHHREGRDE